MVMNAGEGNGVHIDVQGRFLLGNVRMKKTDPVAKEGSRMMKKRVWSVLMSVVLVAGMTAAWLPLEVSAGGVSIRRSKL